MTEYWKNYQILSFSNHTLFLSLETRANGLLKSPTRICARDSFKIDLLPFNDFTRPKQIF